MASPWFDNDESRSQVPLGRLLVVVLSLLWAIFPGFALIDLDAAIPPGDPRFREHWILEGSWGALVTGLIVVPLLVASVRPTTARHVAQQQAVVIVCFVVAAALCGVVEFLLLPLGVGLSTLAWWWPLRMAVKSSGQLGRMARWWPLLLIGTGYLGLPLLAFGPGAFTVKTVGILCAVGALVAWLAWSLPRAGEDASGSGRVSLALLLVVVGAAGPWMAYALSMAAESRDGLVYLGSGIDRVVAQAALPLLIVAHPLAAAVGWLPLRLAVWPAAAVAAGFGSFAAIYPDHLGSPGSAWGYAAVVWSVALLLVAERPHRRIERVKGWDPLG